MYPLATTHSEKPSSRNFRVWNNYGLRGHATMAIPGAAFSAVRPLTATLLFMVLSHYAAYNALTRMLSLYICLGS